MSDVPVPPDPDDERRVEDDVSGRSGDPRGGDTGLPPEGDDPMEGVAPSG